MASAALSLFRSASCGRQLEPTDHDHLGKLIVYMSNLEANTAIWITQDARPEHVQAVDWLNAHTATDIRVYLVRLEAYRIGDSLAAPLFTVLAGPAEQRKRVTRDASDLAERHHLRLRFWEQLLAKAKLKTRLHERISPSRDNWVSASAGVAGFSYQYVVRMHDATAQLSIATGKEEETKRLFAQLKAQRSEIEDAFGGPVIWEEQAGRDSCGIQVEFPDAGLLDEDRWPDLHDRMIDAMIRLYRALDGRLPRR